jgi:Protein of unknown function (DUF2695)
MARLRLVSDEDAPGPPADPYPHECVACFVERMTRAHGCSNQLTWAALWRDRCAPRATALERRLQSRGGFCDCEMLTNVYARTEWLREQWVTDPDDLAPDDPDAEPPPCFGVRKGSTQPCAHWVPPSP